MPEGPSAQVRLSEARPRGLRQPLLAVLAVFLQAAPGLGGGRLLALRPWLVVGSGVLLAIWFVVNFRASSGLLRMAFAVALVGAGLNLAVMVPNGGMPVSKAAMESMHRGRVDIADGHLYKHRLADDRTVLAWLGDVIPVRPLHLVASLGDAVLLIGIMGVGIALAAPRRRLA